MGSFALLILIRWGLLAGAFGITSWILSDDLDVSGGIAGHLLAAAVFAIVNALIGPVLRLLTLPINVVTLGLFSIVVNAVLLLIAAGLTDVLVVDGLGTAIVGALVLAIVSAILNAIVVGRR